MFELEKQQIEAADRQNIQPKTYRMFFVRDFNQAPNIHRGRLNLPISGEIAAVYVDNDGAPPQNVDICIYPRHTQGQNQHRISYLSQLCDPVCYPLLFLNGELGIKY